MLVHDEAKKRVNFRKDLSQDAIQRNIRHVC